MEQMACTMEKVKGRFLQPSQELTGKESLVIVALISSAN